MGLDTGKRDCLPQEEEKAMNPYQEVWWEQSRSDHTVLLLLRRHGADPCHQLHYLQMVTEKLAKAYFWRSGNPPPKQHAGFVQFMRSLGGIQQSKRARLATILGFKNFKSLQTWIPSVSPLVYELERLAPAMAQNGPNPEYPWPHNAPTEYPARYQFDLWGRLINTGRGHQLMRAIHTLVDKFPSYG
jgi:hypothetical protein